VLDTRLVEQNREKNRARSIFSLAHSPYLVGLIENPVVAMRGVHLLSRHIRPQVITPSSIRYFRINRYLLEVKPFLLADIGEGIAEVELMAWFVKKGDKVKAFDKLCEVQSDKATVEITSRFEGTVLNVHHNVGDIVKVDFNMLSYF
jgi:hypothetical protein